MTPVQTARARERRLSRGLQALAAKHGHKINPPLIDSNGEFLFVVDGRYGQALADRLNEIPVRHGLVASKGHVLAGGNWCRINHFDAERLLSRKGKKENEMMNDVFSVNKFEECGFKVPKPAMFKNDPRGVEYGTFWAEVVEGTEEEVEVSKHDPDGKRMYRMRFENYNEFRKWAKEET